MVEFLFHFQNLVEEKGGKIIDSCKQGETEFHCAILPIESGIQSKDSINGGVAILWENKKLKLRSFVFRQVCQNGALKPEIGRSKDFFAHELEGFVIELFSHIETLKLHHMEEWGLKFKQAKKGKNPISLNHLDAMLTPILPHPDRKQLISHYISEEDKRGLNPLGIYGRRIRRSQTLDRYDAAVALMALAQDLDNPLRKWKVMELAGEILWQEKGFESVLHAPSTLKILFDDRRSFFAND
ncbi:MAG: hypothetical protein R8P61_08270 [Bacteroidia bacterium]|nr:hypothetical protein [Bacteroidia bacterium]